MHDKAPELRHSDRGPGGLPGGCGGCWGIKFNPLTTCLFFKKKPELCIMDKLLIKEVLGSYRVQNQTRPDNDFFQFVCIFK